jgi:aldose 1-epimerase
MLVKPARTRFRTLLNWTRCLRFGGAATDPNPLRAVAIALMMLGLEMTSGAAVTKVDFGRTPDGRVVEVITLTSGALDARVITYGARLIRVRAPNRTGTMQDVVLGYDTLPEWLADKKTHFGAVVGRYGNRIAKGAFTLDGHQYQIPVNNNGNALHGGTVGFDKKLWTPRLIPHGVELTLVSPDGDMGFPGTLIAKVTYMLVRNSLTLQYQETSDKPTVANLTNHTYFNLSSNDQRDILGHQVTLHALAFTPIDKGLIPTGEIRSVENTPMDFRTPHTIGQRIDSQDEQIGLAGGYDHNWVLEGREGTLREPNSGRTLTVMTTEPGVQFYSGNFLDGTFTGRHGKRYTRNMGFCLETQHFPDSPNHPNFPSTVLRPGQVRRSTTTFVFGIAP